MAQQDLAGMLTGITQAPIDPMVTSGNQAQRVARAQQYGTQMRQGIGSLFGADTRTTKEKADQMLASLDVTKKADRDQMLQIVGNVNPQAVPSLKAKFAQMDKEQGLLSTQISSDKSRREAVAKQLTDTHPDLAKGIIAELGSGGTESLKAGLLILTQGAKPVKPEKDTANIAEYQLAVKQGYKGNLQDWILAKKTPLVSTVETPQQKKIASNLERQEAMYDLTRDAAPANITKAQTARKVLKTVNDGMATGAFPEFVANQSAAFQGVLQKFGLDVPVGLAKNVLQQSELKKIQVDGMLPFIAEQGRGWTDADRENYFKTSAGFTQPWQYNEVVALTDLQNAIDGLDKNQFAYSRAKLDTVTDLDGDTLYADYLKHLPRTKVISGFKRGDLTYDKLEVIEDGANLSQYWVESIPKGFMLEKPNGETVDMSWEDINATAQGRKQTAREFLAEQELKGSIKKAL